MAARVQFPVVAAALVGLGCIAAQAQDSGSGLASALKQHYKLATSKLDTGGKLTFEPGTRLTVRKEGIMSFETTDTSIATLCPSRVEGGTVHRSSDLACTKLAPVKKQAFKLSETVCVTAIDVNSTTDKLSMVLVSCDPYNPVPTRKTNRAVVFFVFPKGTLGKATPAKIEEVISQTLSEEHSDAAAKPASPAGAPAAKEAPPKGDPGQSGETKDKDSVPPSNGGTDTDGGRRKGDGPDAQRETGKPASSKDQPKQDDTAPADDAAKVSQIEKGETIEQVTAILGQPSSITDLQTTLFVYPKIQVLFVNGKVTEVHPRGSQEPVEKP